MAYTTIDKSSLHFSPTLYVGNGGTKTVTGIPFEPDMSWLKNRSTLGDNEIYDKVRGATYRIYPNNNSAQDALAQGLQAWTSDGFTVGNNGAINGNGNNIVSWNWKANGAGSSNTDGTINTIKTSANTTSGVSISTYTGTGSAGTIGHGLGVAPTAIWIKKTSAGGAENWFCWNKGLTSAGGFLKLDRGDAASTNNTAFPWNPQANTFGVSTDAATNASGVTYIAYCFADVQGFSKMNSYLGNGSTNGSFIYTGFSPAVVIMKNVTNAATPWLIWDNKRPGYNVTNLRLRPNTADAEDTSTADPVDLLSNGFKCRGINDDSNKAGSTFIYLAFAEAPLVGSNNVPANAR